MIKNSFYRRIYLVFVTAIVVTLAYYFFAGLAKADPTVGESGDHKMLDFGGKIGRKEVFIEVTNQPGKITIKRSLFSWCSSELSGFENEAKINGLWGTSENQRLIEIAGPVGAHGENRQYFYLDANLCPLPIAFVKNDLSVYNIYSDEPNFTIADFNSDNYLDIGAEYREYDKNPLVDGIREIYLFLPQERIFIFNKSEKIVWTNEM